MIKQIINRLILYAKGKGLSQTDLSDRLDIAKQNLSNWKSGSEKPSLVKFLDFILLFPFTGHSITFESRICCGFCFLVGN